MNLSKTVQAFVSRLRSLLRHAWVYALYMSGALARAKSRIRSNEGALVLTFHRVLPVSSWNGDERTNFFVHDSIFVR